MKTTLILLIVGATALVVHWSLTKPSSGGKPQSERLIYATDPDNQIFRKNSHGGFEQVGEPITDFSQTLFFQRRVWDGFLSIYIPITKGYELPEILFRAEIERRRKTAETLDWRIAQIKSIAPWVEVRVNL